MTDWLDKLSLPPEIEAALANGAALSISISGGKDSDAMAVLLKRLHETRQYPGRLELCHCDLGRSEHIFTEAYIRRRAAELGLPLTVVRHPDLDLFDLFVRRSRTRPEVPLWPSAVNRYCTSFKTTEIDKHLRQWVGKGGTVISAVGIRAAESPARARKPVACVREHITTRTRTGFTWSPIHALSTDEVWEVLGVSPDELRRVRATVQAIRAAGGTVEQALAEVGWKLNPVYALGAGRLSCSLCIVASQADLRVGVEHNPAYYQALVDLEIQTGWAFQHGHYLAELRPDLLTERQRQAFAAMRAARQPPSTVVSTVRLSSNQPVQLGLF